MPNAKAKIKSEILDIVKKESEDLLEKIGINAKVNTSFDEEDNVFVEIDTPKEKGILIGKKGENLQSLQIILGMILHKKLGQWYRVLVDVGGWRKKEEERLRELADQAIKRARETKEPQVLYNLSPSQRRFIHIYVSKFADLITESQGEGVERYLIIKPKTLP